VLARTREVWDELDGARVLITGGTGFVGRWLLHSLIHAERRTGSRINAVVLTRSPAAFAEQEPALAEHVSLLSADVRSIRASDIGNVDAVIHAATSTDAATNAAAPAEVFDVAARGTAVLLDAVAAAGRIPFLLTSSGAVYGAQPESVARFDETNPGAPDPLASGAAYANGKRAAESACALAALGGGPAAVIARLFAFIGPFLPMDTHFAVGNFCRDALAGRPVVVHGDGRTVRSYLYAADLATWLWTLLLRGQPGRAYNVGSEDARSLAEVAELVGAAAPAGPVPVEVLGAPAAISRYVPDTRRARDELGLAETVPLEDGVARTLLWARTRLS
jgi:nucleoside-diphosphate-sugar epimerase